MPGGKEWAADPLLPDPRRRAAAALIVVCVAVTAILGWAFAGQAHADAFDAVVDGRFRGSLGKFPVPLRLLARLGEPGPATVMAVVLAAACLVTRRWRGALLAAVAVAAAGALTEFVLKPLIGRTIGGAYSFPSGHTTGMFALAVTCVVLLTGPGRPRLGAVSRHCLALGAVLVAAAVAAAVVSLSMHYFTDTIGGAAVGTSTVLLTALVIDRLWPGTR